MKRIFQKGSFEVVIENNAGPEIFDLFGSTILGTPGKIRYQFMEVRTKMAAITNCYYLTIRKGDRLIGTIGFVKRTTLHQEKPYDSWYIRYFSIKAPLRSDKQEDININMKKDSHFDNIFKSLAAEYFENPYLFLDESSPSSAVLLYGVVEKGNIRSQQFTRIVGFETVREFCTIAFSRIILKQHRDISRITETEKSGVVPELTSFYRTHTFFTMDNIFFNNNYFVCRDGKEIVAGLQANPETWRIVEMPGFNGWLLLNVLPYVPGISSFYKPKAFRFIAIEGLFYKEGYEDRIMPLIETALAIHKAHFALTWMDTGSPVFRRLQEFSRFGVLSRFISRIPADIKIRFIGCSNDEKKIYYNNPVYLSCFDMT